MQVYVPSVSSAEGGSVATVITVSKVIRMQKPPLPPLVKNAVGPVVIRTDHCRIGHAGSSDTHRG